jgi:hypothetical protein
MTPHFLCHQTVTKNKNSLSRLPLLTEKIGAKRTSKSHPHLPSESA